MFCCDTSIQLDVVPSWSVMEWSFERVFLGYQGVKMWQKHVFDIIKKLAVKLRKS